MSDYILRDLQRRLANVVRRGRVHSVDFEQVPPRVKVEYAVNAITAWLPYISMRASADCSTWEPLSIGEQVVILSEGGDLACGIAVPSIHYNDALPPSVDPNEHVTLYSDGTTISYNRESHLLKIVVGEGGDVEINANNVIINANIKHVGNQTTTGNIAATGNVSDGVRSMKDDRDIYNDHDHQTPHGTSNKPNQQQ